MIKIVTVDIEEFTKSANKYYEMAAGSDAKIMVTVDGAVCYEVFNERVSVSGRTGGRAAAPLTYSEFELLLDVLDPLDKIGFEPTDS